MLLAFVPLLARSRVSAQQMFFAQKRSANQAAAAPSHGGVATGCDGFSLRDSIADPQGVAQS